jgi:UDPglucose--hexose-1-phosphate uridylyltransferase
MSELRQDPITHDWVIINPGRASRPHDGAGAGTVNCPFCPGNEAMTPGEVDSICTPDGSWLVRAVPNRFPVLSEAEPDPPLDAPHGGLWSRRPGYGHHEVIIESRDHELEVGLMPVEQLRRVLEMYVRRARALAARDGRLRQIVLFRNHGTRAGTSIAHPHSQIVATPTVSPETRRRVMDEIAFFDENGCCGLCRELDLERASGERIVLETQAFVTLAPYASGNPYQLQIAPRRHCASFLEVEEPELDDLAGHLRRVLAALFRNLADPHYNLVVSSAPLDLVHRSASHWFVEILPRLTTPAGFELGSRIVVNVQTPERAAVELRAQIADLSD